MHATPIMLVWLLVLAIMMVWFLTQPKPATPSPVLPQVNAAQATVTLTLLVQVNSFDIPAVCSGDRWDVTQLSLSASLLRCVNQAGSGTAQNVGATGLQVGSAYDAIQMECLQGVWNITTLSITQSQYTCMTFNPVPTDTRLLKLQLMPSSVLGITCFGQSLDLVPQGNAARVDYRCNNPNPVTVTPQPGNGSPDVGVQMDGSFDLSATCWGPRPQFVQTVRQSPPYLLYVQYSCVQLDAATPTPEGTATDTPMPTDTPLPPTFIPPTPIPTDTPTATSTETATPTGTATPTATPTITPTPTATGTPTATPVPLPKVVSDDDLRRLAQDTIGVSFNPDAALEKHARAHGLGNPLASEGRYSDAQGNRWAWQPFALGIVRTLEGHWADSDMQVVEW